MSTPGFLELLLPLDLLFGEDQLEFIPLTSGLLSESPLFLEHLLLSGLVELLLDTSLRGCENYVTGSKNLTYFSASLFSLARALRSASSMALLALRASMSA